MGGEKVRFDRVLCDVPCCGDGTIRKAPILYASLRATPGCGRAPIVPQITTQLSTRSSQTRPTGFLSIRQNHIREALGLLSAWTPLGGVAFHGVQLAILQRGSLR